jgi:kynurenine formamidase
LAVTSAWGRWGETDQRGAANLIDEAAVARAFAAVRDYRPISLAASLSARSPVAPNRQPMTHFFTRDGGDYVAGRRTEVEDMGFADDYVLLGGHGTTHIDALSHVWSKGKMYNNFDAAQVTSSGAAVLGVENIGPIVTRGILLDAAAEPQRSSRINPERLTELLSAASVTPQPGDALLVRTGWAQHKHETPGGLGAEIGLTRSCSEWLAGYDLAVVGADNLGIEVAERHPGGAPPLHVSLIRDRGVYMLELLDLEELAAASRPEFMLVLNPLPIQGGTGGPCAPVAIV